MLRLLSREYWLAVEHRLGARKRLDITLYIQHDPIRRVVVVPAFERGVLAESQEYWISLIHGALVVLQLAIKYTIGEGLYPWMHSIVDIEQIHRILTGLGQTLEN